MSTTYKTTFRDGSTFDTLTTTEALGEIAARGGVHRELLREENGFDGDNESAQVRNVFLSDRARLLCLDGQGDPFATIRPVVTPEPLPSPESLTFGDFLTLQGAVIGCLHNAARRLKEEKEIADDPEYSDRLRSSYRSSLGARRSEVQRLEEVLSKLQRCFGAAVKSE